jgi:REP element-mobilizing transposase RayT
MDHFLYFLSDLGYKQCLPRKARIDGPGGLHHVITRGIEKRDIFWDDDDRNNFLERLGTIIDDSGTRCYAWALLPNHCHLLFETGLSPIATVMRSRYLSHPSVCRFIAVSKSLKTRLFIIEWTKT